MKSFLRGLKNVGKIFLSPEVGGLLGIVAKIAPIPGVGLAVSIIQTAAKVEARHMDDKNQTSTQKAADFMADFEDGIATANVGLAMKGKKMVYDTAKVAAARDAMVAALNAARDAQESVDIVDLAD